MAHPVGTGPYRLAEWRRGQRIVLEAEPGISRRALPAGDRSRRPRARRGADRPQAAADRRIEISIIEESQPRLLAFRQGESRLRRGARSTSSPRCSTATTRSSPTSRRPGVRLARGVQPAITYVYFNMEDPVVGGYTPAQIALRRAIAMAYNVDDDIRVLRQGQGVRRDADRPAEHDGARSDVRRRIPFDVAAASAARQVRLHRPRRRRLPRPARRQAAAS